MADLMQLHEDRTSNDDMRETREFVQEWMIFLITSNVRDTDMGHCKQKPNCFTYTCFLYSNMQIGVEDMEGSL